MITIEHWPEERWPNGEVAIKQSTFVRHNRKRVDPWFARYVQGQEPSRYPMPAIRYETVFFPYGKGSVFTAYKSILCLGIFRLISAGKMNAEQYWFGCHLDYL